jgi:hypothetical protein
MSSIYTLTFRGPGDLLVGDRPTLRMELGARAVEIVATMDEGAMFALPAGFLHARSAEERDGWAEQLLGWTRDYGVGMAFGIDRVDSDELGVGCRPESFAYACDRGRRLLWGAAATRERKDALSDRPVTIGGRRLVVLLQSEIFRASARAVVEETRPDLTLVLAYAGATPRWAPSLAALEALAPTMIVHEDLQLRRPVSSQAPRGWRAEVAATTPFVTIHRFAVDADGAQPSAMGH